jgi:hypothetical protein
MGAIERPKEFWKVVAKSSRVKRERTYNGPSAKKKAMEFAYHAKKNGATEVEIFSCIPQWNEEEKWSLPE